MTRRTPQAGDTYTTCNTAIEVIGVSPSGYVMGSTKVGRGLTEVWRVTLEQFHRDIDLLTWGA